MEEDIKVLEKYVEKDIPCNSCKYCAERPKVAGALRNLIKGYKELEKKYKIRKEIYDRDIKAVDEKWKSKVREKIEEEKKKIKEDLENYKKIEDESWKKAIHQSINIRNRKIEGYEELLQEGDK